MTAPAIEYPTEPCRSCGKPVIWATTERLRSMPVDAEPSTNGSILLVAQADGKPPTARVFKVGDRFGRTNLRVSHFATCPDAPKWRTRKTSAP